MKLEELRMLLDERGAGLKPDRDARVPKAALRALLDVAEAAEPFAVCSDPFLTMPISPCGDCNGCKLTAKLAALEAACPSSSSSS